MRWQYTALEVDARTRLSAQADVVRDLAELGRGGWEAFAVTPPAPAYDDPDAAVPTYEVLLRRRLDAPPVETEYETVGVDVWIGVGASGAAKPRLRELGEQGWEAFAVTPPTVPPGEGARDPDESSYEILLRRRAEEAPP